jgi:5-formyltetrahydrofolate cyclo-ligase
VKKLLRKRLIEKRKMLSKKDILERSESIKRKLFDLDEFKNASTVLFYVSYNNEVFTHNMIRDALSFGKIIVVPISIIEERKLMLSMLENFEDLRAGSYGILEPKPDKIKEISINEIDLIIVPGVGFDTIGHRIGHGKGYYDELIKRSMNHMHIGLAFELQLVKKIPTKSHDLPVKRIITEKRIINCTNG